MSSPGSAEERAVLAFELRVGERTIQAKARLPVGEVRVIELLPVLRKFNDAIIGAAVEDTRVEGRTISCRAGCGACCRQIVPISEHEALALLEWIDTLPESQQALIRSKFASATAALETKGMLERTRESVLTKDRVETLRFSLDYFHAGVPCPFLIDESCSIHPIRPMKCREYLVTSPAENCAQPSAESIAMVEMPTNFSNVLFQFDAARTAGGSRWLPLVLLFEYDAQLRQNPQRRADSVALFQEFLAAFVDATPEALEEMLRRRPDTEATAGQPDGPRSE